MIAETLFKDFLKTVIAKGVFSEEERARDMRPLSTENASKIASGKRLDHRLPWLSRVSGKGGRDAKDAWHRDWRNVSLLEHATSVARGAVVFAERDIRDDDHEIDESDLRARLARILAAGFLHDADKMLEVDRTTQIDTDSLSHLIARYRVSDFLSSQGAAASPGWLLSMIDQAEVTRSGRLTSGGVALSTQDRNDAQYIRIADRMDGIFLKDGAQAALDDLAAFDGFRSGALQAGWRTIDIFQPQLPFILDALQIAISNACRDETGLPPLLEAHQDGRLIAVIPEKASSAIVETAIADMRREFKPRPRININNKNAIDLCDGRAEISDLMDEIAGGKIRSNSLTMSKDLIFGEGNLAETISEALDPAGISIDWPSPDKDTRASAAPLPGAQDDRHDTAFNLASAISITLRCKEPGVREIADRTLGSEIREHQLTECLRTFDVVIPDSIAELDHKITRHAIIALVTGAFAQEIDELHTEIFGDGGLVETWLDGDDAHAGINARIPDDAAGIFLTPIREMVLASLDRKFQEGDEYAPRRCHFTNRPVDEDAKYASGQEGVYALKVSAFSGREGRPETFRTTRSGTWLSGIARAEHSLRFRKNDGNAKGDLSFHLSCPTTSGLFASLTFGRNTEITEISTYELRKVDPKKVAVPFTAFDGFEKRVLIGRFESQKTKLAETLDLVLRIVEAALRTGRPIHVFQGLPHDVRDRVYFDALPREIERGFGRKGFRIEELPALRDTLRLWSNIAAVNGLGIGLAAQVMDPDTRLPALCDALSRLERMGNSDHASLQAELSHHAQELIMKETKDSPVVRFARAMTGFQRGFTHNDSRNLKERGMRKAIEEADRLEKARTTDRETMVCAIISALEDATTRETDTTFVKRAEGEVSHMEALTRAAEIFADEIWSEIFRGRAPDSRLRSTTIGIYRVAFERAHQMRKAGETVFPQ